MTWASLARYAWAVLSYRRESAWRWLSIVARRRWRVFRHRKMDMYSVPPLSIKPGQVILPPTNDIMVRWNYVESRWPPGAVRDTGDEAASLLRKMQDARDKMAKYEAVEAEVARYPH